MSRTIEYVGSFLCADTALVLVIVVARYLSLREHVCVADPLGAVGWSFSESWASTITGVGAVLGLVVSSQMLDPEKPETAALASLDLLFGTLVLVAPLLFMTFSKPKLDTPNQADAPLYRGFVFGFLAASSITLWAVTGQLVALAMLVRELQSDVLLQRIWIAVTISALVLVWVYAWRTMRAVMLYKAKASGPKMRGISGAPSKPQRWALL